MGTLANSENLDEMHQQGATLILFYSIRAVVLIFITGVRIKEIKSAFSFQCFRLKKVLFFCVVLYKIGKKLNP